MTVRIRANALALTITHCVLTDNEDSVWLQTFRAKSSLNYPSAALTFPSREEDFFQKRNATLKGKSMALHLEKLCRRSSWLRRKAYGAMCAF